MKLSDKQKQTINKLKDIDSGNDFFWDEKTGIAKFIKGKLSKTSNDEPETIAGAFLDENAGLQDLSGTAVKLLVRFLSTGSQAGMALLTKPGVERSIDYN